MTPITIKHLHLSEWNAQLNYAVCDNTAALILPSMTIPTSSPGACRCNMQTGELSYSKGNKFLRESTLREMDDVQFRLCCYENMAIFNTVSHKPNNPQGLKALLQDFLSGVEMNNVMLCYGGDIVRNANSLQCIANAAAEFPDKQLCCKTSNSSALLTFAINNASFRGICPPNLFIFLEDPGVKGVEFFPTLTRTANGAVEDGPGLFPVSENSITVKIDPNSDARRKRKASWWQVTKTPKNKKKNGS